MEEQRTLIRQFVRQLPRREAEAITLYALDWFKKHFGIIFREEERTVKVVTMRPL